MTQTIKKLLFGLPAMLAVTLFAFVATANAAVTEVVVTPSNNQGWVFNPDPANATPYQFTEDQASVGEGSLYVQPIDAVGAHKFIATKTLNVATPSLTAMSYDFLIAGDGTASDAQQFYLNVYTKTAGSTAFYDCRFDYVPGTGSTAAFTTASFAATDTPTNVADRFPADAFVCPPTLAGMPADSTVSFVALNVGDTSTNDEGLAGYLDRAVLTVAGDETTYNFETDPTVLGSKTECKEGGWMASEAPVFKNQGDCVSWFVSKNQ